MTARGHDAERLPAGVCAVIALAGSVAAWGVLLWTAAGLWSALQAVTVADVVAMAEQVARAACLPM